MAETTPDADRPVKPASSETLVKAAPGFDPEATLLSPGGRAVPGVLPHVPGYEVLGMLGRGGMGVVYKARQLGLNRLVAIKMILSGSHADEEELHRFRAEAEAVARLQHPNIVQIFEVGERDGNPFFSMELVEGGSLKRHLRGRPQPPSLSAALIRTLAEAIHAAHRRGIVHRDLKPGNVLLQYKDPERQEDMETRRPGDKEEDGASVSLSPDLHVSLSPKISDFGLAKLLGDQERTASGAVLGTPAYASPEQAAGLAQATGPAADIYALGVLLYECLTGRVPFQGASAWSTLELVRTQEPPAVRRLRPETPRDLETICLKCLEKEPHRRYASAQALADDLGRWLDGEPIRARAVGRTERVVKWARRQPTQAALIAVAALALVLGGLGAGAAWLWQRAEAAGDQLGVTNQRLQVTLHSEEELRDRLEQADYLNRVRLAHREALHQEFDRAAALLAGCPPARRHWEWRYVQALCRSGEQVLRGHGGQLLAAVISPAGDRLLSLAAGDEVKLWSLADGTVERTWRQKDTFFVALAWSPDGRFIATSGIHRLPMAEAKGLVQIWDLDGRLVTNLGDLSKLTTALEFSPDGRWLAAVGYDRRVQLWEVATWTAGPRFGTDSELQGVAFSPDSRLVAAARDGDGVPVWDIAADRLIATLPGVRFTAGVAFGPGRRLAAVDTKGAVWAWSLDQKKVEALQPATEEGCRRLAFLPGGEILVGRGKQVVVIGPGGERVLGEHAAPVYTVSAGGDGRRLASGASDGTIRIWRLAAADSVVPAPLRVLPKPGYHARLSRDGQRVALLVDGNYNGAVRCQVLDWAGNRLSEYSLPTSAPEGTDFAPDLRQAATVDRVKVRLWDGQTGQPLGELTPAGPAYTLGRVAYSPDGRWLAAWGDGHLTLWDRTTARAVYTIEIGPLRLGGLIEVTDPLVIAPDGRTFAYALDNVVILRSLADGEEWRRLQVHQGRITDLAFDADSRLLAAAGVDRGVRLWETATGREVAALVGNSQMVGSLSFSPDGKRLATGTRDGSMRLWDVVTGEEALVLESPDRRYAAYDMAFSAGGQRLLWMWFNNLYLADVP